MNINNDFEEIFNKEKEDFSDGDLVVIIACKNCDAQYEINPTSIAMALATNASIWDYIKYVQHSKCRECNRKKDVMESK